MSCIVYNIPRFNKVGYSLSLNAPDTENKKTIL